MQPLRSECVCVCVCVDQISGGNSEVVLRLQTWLFRLRSRPQEMSRRLSFFHCIAFENFCNRLQTEIKDIVRRRERELPLIVGYVGPRRMASFEADQTSNQRAKVSVDADIVWRTDLMLLRLTLHYPFPPLTTSVFLRSTVQSCRLSATATRETGFVAFTAAVREGSGVHRARNRTILVSLVFPLVVPSSWLRRRAL